MRELTCQDLILILDLDINLDLIICHQDSRPGRRTSKRVAQKLRRSRSSGSLAKEINKFPVDFFRVGPGDAVRPVLHCH